MTSKNVSLGIVAALVVAGLGWWMIAPTDPLAKFTDQQLGAALHIIGIPLPNCSNSIPEGCKSARDRLAQGRKQYATYDPRETRRAILAWYDVVEQNIQAGERDEQYRYRIQNALKSVAKGN